MLHIIVDADACPVKKEIYRVADRYQLNVTLVANAWMQNPVGFELVNGRAQMVDFPAIIANPNIFYQFPHVVAGAFTTAGFFVVAISAFRLRLEAGTCWFESQCETLVSHDIQMENYRVTTGYPDPQLMVTWFPEPIETRLGPQDWNAQISQMIPFPGKLSKAGELVAAEARIARLKLDI